MAHNNMTMRKIRGPGRYPANTTDLNDLFFQRLYRAGGAAAVMKWLQTKGEITRRASAARCIC